MLHSISLQDIKFQGIFLKKTPQHNKPKQQNPNCVEILIAMQIPSLFSYSHPTICNRGIKTVLNVLCNKEPGFLHIAAVAESVVLLVFYASPWIKRKPIVDCFPIISVV